MRGLTTTLTRLRVHHFTGALGTVGCIGSLSGSFEATETGRAGTYILPACGIWSPAYHNGDNWYFHRNAYDTLPCKKTQLVDATPNSCFFLAQGRQVLRNRTIDTLHSSESLPVTNLRTDKGGPGRGQKVPDMPQRCHKEMKRSAMTVFKQRPLLQCPATGPQSTNQKPSRPFVSTFRTNQLASEQILVLR